jgi:hypothetical protein
MTDAIELTLGDDSFRFTSEGMIFVDDLIKALLTNQSENTAAVWKRMKEDHPGILEHCGSYATADGKLVQIIDIEGFDKFFQLLPEYM